MIKLDETLLIRLAGVRAFGQGMHCFEEGRVSSFETRDRSTRGVVQDDGPQEVRLRHTHSMIERECDCEASGGIDFCRHCVALALALQDKLSTRKPLPKRSAVAAIRRQLAELSHEALVDEFMEIVGQDRALRDNLFQKTQFVSVALTYADLYVRDLGDSFRHAILSEIDTRLAAVSTSDSAESESLRDALEKLKATVANGETG